MNELLFDLIKKYPGYQFLIGYNEKYDWFEVYIIYGSFRVMRTIPSWLSEMYSKDTVHRTLVAAVEELAATVEMKGE